jgi:hypothetical protein
VCVCVCVGWLVGWLVGWFCPILGITQTLFYDGVRGFVTRRTSFTHTLPSIPPGYTMMVSFPNDMLESCITLSELTSRRGVLDDFCCVYPAVPKNYKTYQNTTPLRVYFRLEYNSCLNSKLNQDGFYKTLGFHMKYSLVPDDLVLNKLPSGLWNCSVPHWAELKRHFPCNLQKDCEGGEDEVDCPYYR